MRSFARHFLILLVAAIVCAPAMGQVHWQTDLEAAKRTAAQTNKLVLLHFWASWCQPCMKLESTVFNQPGLGDAIAKDFVAVKVNIDHRPTTARQYGVKSIPADVIITPDGQMIEMTASPHTAAAYLGRIQRVAAKVPNRGLQAYANIGSSPPGTAAPPTTQPANTAPVGAYGQFPAHNSAAPLGQRLAANTTGVPNGQYGQQPPRPTNPPTNAGAAPPAPTGDKYADYGGNATLARGPSAFGQHDTSRPANPVSPPASGAPAFQPPNPRVASQTPPATQPSPTIPPQNPAPSFTPPQAAPPQTPPQHTTPPTTPPQTVAAPTPKWGMDAFCPVTLNEKKKWAPGDKRWGVEHQGRVYLFTSDEAKRKFLANPNYYAPVFAGHDPVLLIEQRMPVPGKREHGVFYRDRVYMFTSEATLEKFSNNPAQYATQVSAMEAQAARR